MQRTLSVLWTRRHKRQVAGVAANDGDDATSIQIPVLTMPSAAKPPPMLHGASKSARHFAEPKKLEFVAHGALDERSHRGGNDEHMKGRPPRRVGGCVKHVPLSARMAASPARRTPSQRMRAWEEKKTKHNEWRAAIGLQPHRYDESKQKSPSPMKSKSRSPKPRRLQPGRGSPTRTPGEGVQEPLLQQDMSLTSTPPPKSASDSLCIAYVVAAAVPLACTWSAWASNYGHVAMMSAFIMSSVAVVGVLASPVAQDVAYADDGGLGDKSGSADIADDAMGEQSIFLLPYDCCMASLAWAVHLLMGLTGIGQLVLLVVGPPETLAAIVLNLLCAFVQISDSLSRFSFGRSLAVQMGSTEAIQCVREMMNGATQRIEQVTVLTADSIATHSTRALSKRTTFSRIARISLRLAYRSSRDVLSLVRHSERPWWAWIARQLNGVGYTARQSPLKVLILIINIVGVIDGIDLELQRSSHIEGAHEHVGIGTSIGTFLIEVLVADLLVSAEFSSAAATAAATSDFVRKRVRPAEYAKGKRRELERWQRAQRRAAAILRLREAMAMPPLQVDVYGLTGAITEAETVDVGVDGSLIQEAKRYAAVAEEAQGQDARHRRATSSLLERLLRQPPLETELPALEGAISDGRAVGVDSALLNLAVDALTGATRTQHARERARARLQSACEEPTHIMRGEPGFGVRIDTAELTDAIREAKESWVEEEIIDAAASTLIEAIAAQRKLTLVIAAFFGRLSARVTRARREATALAHVEATRKAAAVALAKLHEPAHVSDLLDIASAELHQAITDARGCGCESSRLHEAEREFADLLSTSEMRRAAQEKLNRALQTAEDALACLAHCSSSNIVRVLSQLDEATAAAAAALVPTTAIAAAEVLRTDLSELEAGRSKARARLEAATHTLESALWRVGRGANLSSVHLTATRQEADRATGAARTASVDVDLIVKAETALSTATRTEELDEAATRCRKALEQLRSAPELSASAADELEDRCAALTDALDAAGDVAKNVARHVVSRGSETLEEANFVLSAHIAARENLAACTGRTRLALRKGSGESSLEELTAAVAALEQAVFAAGENYVNQTTIREAQLLLTRARAVSRGRRASLQS